MTQFKKIIPLGGNNEYVINGICYNVISRFMPGIEKESTVTEKFKNILGSNFTDLKVSDNNGNMNNDVCPTVGKEEKCSQ